MHELIHFENNIITSGTIECTFHLNANVRTMQIEQSIAISHNVHNEITYLTELKMLNHQQITIKDINQTPNKLIIILDIECENGQTMSQNLKFTHDSTFYYFGVISTFYFHQKIISHTTRSNKHWKEYQYTISLPSPSVQYHDIRRCVLKQSVMDSYDLYLPNGILSIIFALHRSNHLDRDFRSLNFEPLTIPLEIRTRNYRFLRAHDSYLSVVRAHHWCCKIERSMRNAESENSGSANPTNIKEHIVKIERSIPIIVGEHKPWLKRSKMYWVIDSALIYLRIQ
eukprot:850559_1